MYFVDGEPMKTQKHEGVICRLKEMRVQKQLTQIELAEQVGIKRQAIYDIESGRYLPNTGVALKLARFLECRIEDLFQEPGFDQSMSAVVAAKEKPVAGARVASAKINGRVIAHPLGGNIPGDHGLESADAMLAACGKRVTLLHDPAFLERSVLLMGCDPAFSLLKAHVTHTCRESRVVWRFASTHRSLEHLIAGETHLAGIHLHNRGSDESNLALAREKLKGAKGRLVGFSLFEEGLMTAPGNPLNIRGVNDLGEQRIKMVNRERGAALRVLLDDCLEQANIPPASVPGYDDLVASHSEGAHRVMFGTADAALGMRAVAASFGLGFVSLAEVRSDLVIPEEVFNHPTVQVLLDVLQTKAFHRELSSLEGYDSGVTGRIIAEI